MLSKFNKLAYGLVVGFIGPWIGLLLCSIYNAYKYNVTVRYFINDMFLGVKEYQSSIASLSLLFNLAMFMLFLKLNWDTAARGVLMATFLYAPVVVYLFYY